MPFRALALLCPLICGLWIATQAHAQSCTVIDQRHLSSNGNIALYPGQLAGQTFVAGFAGRLVGIELAPLMDTLTPDDVVSLEIFDATDRSLGTVSRPATDFPPGAGNTPDPLHEDSIGSGYFDLTSLGVIVTPGARLFFRVHHDEVGTCDRDTFFCSAGYVGHFCSNDFDCAPAMRLGDESNDPYSGGTERYNGVDQIGYDLAFKTFVAIPCAEPTVTPNPTPSITPSPPPCGNLVLDPGETCDPPSLAPGPNGQPSCRLDCTSCGDGVVQTNDFETCDAGPDALCAACLPNCSERIGPGGGYGGCPCALDTPALADLRADILAACDCGNAASRSAFVRCARAKLRSIAPELLLTPCRQTALKCLARSVCGKPGAVTCCRTSSNGRHRCVVKPDAAHCTGAGTASLGVTETCCDACP